MQWSESLAVRNERLRFGLEKSDDRVFVALLSCQIERGLAERAVTRVNGLQQTRKEPIM